LGLAVPDRFEAWRDERLEALEQRLREVATLASAGKLPEALITEAGLSINPIRQNDTDTDDIARRDSTNAYLPLSCVQERRCHCCETLPKKIKTERSTLESVKRSGAKIQLRKTSCSSRRHRERTLTVTDPSPGGLTPT
jgi:hypothetical protein